MRIFTRIYWEYHRDLMVYIYICIYTGDGIYIHIIYTYMYIHITKTITGYNGDIMGIYTHILTGIL